MADKRRRVRIELSKIALAKGEHKEFEGTLDDISANGASITFGAPLEQDLSAFKSGDSVEIIVDRLTSLSAWVIRCDNKSMAVEFAHDSESENQLIAELMESMD